MTEPAATNPSRVLRTGFTAIFLAAVSFWAGSALDGLIGFGFTMAALGCGAVGLGLVIVEAMEQLSNPQRRRPREPGQQRFGMAERTPSVGRCGICHQRRIQRSGLVVCPTCDRHLTV